MKELVVRGRVMASKEERACVYLWDIHHCLVCNFYLTGSSPYKYFPSIFHFRFSSQNIDPFLCSVFSHPAFILLTFVIVFIFSHVYKISETFSVIVTSSLPLAWYLWTEVVSIYQSKLRFKPKYFYLVCFFNEAIKISSYLSGLSRIFTNSKEEILACT